MHASQNRTVEAQWQTQMRSTKKGAGKTGVMAASSLFDPVSSDEEADEDGDGDEGIEQGAGRRP